MDRARHTDRRSPSPAAPSRTSQAVAAVRAGLPRPHTPGGDPDAQARLCAGMLPSPGTGPPDGPRDGLRDGLRDRLAARTRFFDGQVLAALGRGVRQVVILGAGYDDRALRFRSPGVRFFELDHPATQADKSGRLRRLRADLAGLTLAPADFRRDDVTAVLAASGHDAGQPSLFVCEGLLVYLDQETTARLLAGLRSRSGPAPAGAAGHPSMLAVSLAIHPDGIDSATAVARANAGRPAADAEPWLTILPVAGQLSLLARAGWPAAEVRDDAASGGGQAARRSLLVTARPGPGAPAARTG
jgi:methyltransferase (TIGR00027 family)